jgi:hypothetical protein
VRSSSPLEADGTWSGAFSTFHGITHDELGTAIRGCWGSAFAVNVLDRAAHSDTPPDRLGLAVLIQPELTPELGGTARVTGDGTVHITATSGPLRPLMAGLVEGSTATIAPDGSLDSRRSRATKRSCTTLRSCPGGSTHCSTTTSSNGRPPTDG